MAKPIHYEVDRKSYQNSYSERSCGSRAKAKGVRDVTLVTCLGCKVTHDYKAEVQRLKLRHVFTEAPEALAYLHQIEDARKVLRGEVNDLDDEARAVYVELEIMSLGSWARDVVIKELRTG